MVRVASMDGKDLCHKDTALTSGYLQVAAPSQNGCEPPGEISSDDVQYLKLQLKEVS